MAVLADSETSGRAVKLLRRRRYIRVVSVEWMKGTENSPPRAHLLLGVTAEPADVGSDDGHVVHGREGEQLGNGEAIVIPVRVVVFKPVQHLFAEGG